MPRPSDHYTHSQFEPVESDFQGETVRCMHCKNWSGSVKTLSRKKEHLLKCPVYATWRAAGNGQDLPPPNKYNKRDSFAMNEDPYSSPYAEGNYGPQPTPAFTRNKIPDLSQWFDEFWDDSTAQKCMRARCRYCGAVRAKNSTRQMEHLQQCNDFLNSTEGQQARNDGTLNQSSVEGPSLNRPEVFRGTAPNTNFQLNNQRRRPKAYPPPSQHPHQTPTQPKPSPSLVNHLLTKNNEALSNATQQQFLSHAGCGTLSAAALQQWLTQQGHMSRTLVTFIGNVIGKIRLADSKNPLADTNWRTLDLLVSCINNAKRELEFLRTTAVKYRLQSDVEGSRPATKGLMDLFGSATQSHSSLLEGMVVLWSIQHLHCVSWQYAATFLQSGPPNPTPYSLPSYLQSAPYGASNPFNQPAHADGSEDSANAALREALIPNWTSSGFAKFVDACKAIVDELANSQTSGNGAVELGNCELVFKQVLWLWKQIWPEVSGMGEQDETLDDAGDDSNMNGNAGEGSGANGPIEIPDDEDDDDGMRDEDAPTADCSFEGLGAIAAANRASNQG